MFFTIEPMVNLGRPAVKLLSDGWTAVTRDKSLSAQFEHSVGITETGVEVFTHSPTGLDKPQIGDADFRHALGLKSVAHHAEAVACGSLDRHLQRPWPRTPTAA